MRINPAFPEVLRLIDDRDVQTAIVAAGPDRGCWTWWGRSQAPQTPGA